MQPENLFTTRSIRTFTGKFVNVFDPDPETICIEDIAHALSMQPRFGGHLPEFFSVAQHSIMVANEISQFRNPHLVLQALMHDATEAYVLDMPRPIKLELPEYKKLEVSLMEVIAKKFRFHPVIDEVVKRADRCQLQREWDDIMLCNHKLPKIRCMSQREAKITFLKSFNYFKTFFPSNV